MTIREQINLANAALNYVAAYRSSSADLNVTKMLHDKMVEAAGVCEQAQIQEATQRAERRMKEEKERQQRAERRLEAYATFDRAALIAYKVPGNTPEYRWARQVDHLMHVDMLETPALDRMAMCGSPFAGAGRTDHPVKVTEDGRLLFEDGSGQYKSILQWQNQHSACKRCVKSALKYSRDSGLITNV